MRKVFYIFLMVFFTQNAMCKSNVKNSMDLGTASATGLASQLVRAAQQTTTNLSANKTLSAIGVSAQAVGTGHGDPGDVRGVRGNLIGTFNFKIPPACKNNDKILSTGLAGTKIITYCHSASSNGAIMANVCIPKTLLDKCSNYTTISIPVNGGSTSALGATWSSTCDQAGKCSGTMSMAHHVVTSSDTITADAQKSIQGNIAYAAIQAKYAAAAQNMQSMKMGGKDQLFVKCMGNVAGYIKGGVYYTCSGAHKGSFSGDYTHKTDIFNPTPTSNFGQVAGYLGALDKAQGDITGSTPPLLFNGSVGYCQKPAKWVPLADNCCSSQVSNHGFHPFNQCKAHDFALAEARRAGRTVEFGEFCSHYFHALFIKFCTQDQQNACIFGSQLAKEIQVQGRKQINNMGSSSEHNAQTQNLTWPYTSSSGAWNKAEVNQVAVAAWTWPGLSPKAIPVAVSMKASLAVPNDGTSVTSGLSISMDCVQGNCNGSITSQGLTKDFSFSPICAKGGPYSWLVATSSVQQGTCLVPGAQPKGWPNVIWKGDTPSLWQFKINSVVPATIPGADQAGGTKFAWQLTPKIQVSGQGGCTGGSCNFDVAVNDHGDIKNGNLSFPLTCTNSKTYQTTIGNITLTPQCPANGEIFAVCTQGDSCGALPADPETVEGQKFNGWAIVGTPASQYTWDTLTQSVFVKGNCSANSNQCVWQVKSIGPNGYPDTITSDVRWNIFSAPLNPQGKPQEGYSKDVVTTASGIQIKPYMYGVNTTPSNEPVMFQIPGGSWQKVTLPISIDQSQPISLSRSPTVSIWGGCSLNTGVCDYKLAAQVRVTGMPWGDQKNPNCVGFTPAQLLLLNWNKMNLGDYLKHYKSATLSETEKAAMTSGASTAAKQFSAKLATGGTIAAVRPNRQNNVALKVSPKEGVGPFTVTLTMVAYWPVYVVPTTEVPHPKNDDPVRYITIKWGDGSQGSVSAAQITYKKIVDPRGKHWVPGHCSGAVFFHMCWGKWIPGHWEAGHTVSIPLLQTSHRYGSPPGATTTQHIIATFYAKSGTYQASADIQNVWQTPNEYVDEGGGGIDTAKQVPANTMPSHGTYNPNQVPGLPK